MSLNIEELANELNVGLESNNFRETEEFTSPTDSDIILLENINRANRLLDRLENNITSGGYSAREVEVASQMITSITATVSTMNQSYFNIETLKQKNLALKLTCIL